MAHRGPPGVFADRFLALNDTLRAVLALLADGYTSHAIAERTGLAVGSVRTHTSTPYRLFRRRRSGNRACGSPSSTGATSPAT